MSKATPQQYRDAIHEMIADYWRAPSIEVKQRHQRAIPIAHGWCAEVHRLAEASLVLIDNGFRHETLILLRTAFELTVSLHWLSEKGEAGVEAVISEGSRNSQALIRSMEKSNFMVPDTVASEVLKLPVNKTDDWDTFRRFKEVCNAIDPRQDLYTLYRHLCGTVHPSTTASSPFIDFRQDPPGLLQKPIRERFVTEATFAQLLIWAGRALDDMVTRKPRKQYLRRKARELQLNPRLPEVS